MRRMLCKRSRQFVLRVVQKVLLSIARQCEVGLQLEGRFLACRREASRSLTKSNQGEAAGVSVSTRIVRAVDDLFWDHTID